MGIIIYLYGVFVKGVFETIHIFFKKPAVQSLFKIAFAYELLISFSSSFLFIPLLKFLRRIDLTLYFSYNSIMQNIIVTKKVHQGLFSKMIIMIK